MHIIKARYYSGKDNFGETFILQSDNGDKDLRIEVGKKVKIIPVCDCGKEVFKNNFCEECYKIAIKY